MSVTTNINPIPQEIQASTFQFPCGDNSLIEGLKTRLVWMSAFAVYMVLVYRSNWQTGLSHALSYTELAALLGMKVSRVKQAMKWLVDNGWVIKNHRGPNKKNTYQIDPPPVRATSMYPMIPIGCRRCVRCRRAEGCADGTDVRR